MKYLKLHIITYCLLVWSFSYSQQFTNFTTEDGLPSNHIYKIAQDAKGFLWIATDKGLVKYNGHKFKTFTTKNGLATNDVWGLNATPDGKLWYHSKSSKTGFIINDSVHAFESETKNEILISTLTSQINNKILLANGKDIYQLEDNKWKKILHFNNAIKEPFTHIQHKTVKNFQINYNKDTLAVLNKNKQVIKRLFIKNILTQQHKRGQLTDSLYYWISDTNYKILNLNTLKLYERTFKNELKINKSQHTRINIVNSQLQITGKGFVGILDHQFHIKNKYLFPENLDAHFGFIDATKNIWLCTFSNGMYKLPSAKRDIIYAFKNEKVNYLTQVNHKVIATVYNKGFFVYQPNNKKFNPFLEKKNFLYQPSFSKELNTEYYFSEKQLTRIRYHTKSKKVKQQILNNDKIKQVVFYNNFLYGVYTFGINKINPNNFEVLEEYPQAGVNFLAVFNDKLLIATTGGLKEFKNNKIKEITFQNQNFDKSIVNIHKISNTKIILNTDGFGTFITNLNTIKQLQKSEFLTVSNAFVEDKNIWLATNKGVLKYIKEDENYIFQKKLDINTGLPSNNINDVLVNNDKLLLSTNAGISIIPTDKTYTPQLLDIYVEKANFNKENITETNSIFTYKNNNTLNFEVATINYAVAKEATPYQYKLEPIQKNWIETSATNISFSSLPPVNYTLHYKTAGIEKTLNFTIKPLWWQLLWVKGLFYFLVISTSVAIVWWLSEKNQEKKNKELLQEKKISEIQLRALRTQMNPHFVFNSLAAIQFYINDNDLETSEKYLVKFSKLIRRFFELSNENEISLSEEIKLLKNYLEIEVLRFKDKLDFTFTIDQNLKLEQIIIPTMLLQPIVENAVNHGIFNKVENGHININFMAIDAETFKVEIIDDGVGFVNTQKKFNPNIKSTSVLNDRIRFLNRLKKWKIKYSTEELHPNNKNKGNIATFIIKQKS